MVEVNTEIEIPPETAWRLCAEILSEFRGKWWTTAGLQCWGCVTFSKGDLAKMCLNNQPGSRGCKLVNARYDASLP
jgi:hypothetical protein